MDTEPAYVYKITDAPLPSPVPEVLPLSELDTKDGFIHLSNAGRIPTTAGLFFEGYETIYVIKIDAAKVRAAGGRLDWVTEKGLEGCVHLHEGRLGKGVIVGEQMYKRQDGHPWPESIGAKI